MRRTPLTMCCSLVCCGAALAFVAGCNPQTTDDTLSDDERPVVTAPVTAPMETAPPTAAPPGQSMPQGPAVLGVATGAPGEYVADGQGRAVYMLEGDTDGSKCTAACLQEWPPLRADPNGPAGAAATGTSGIAGLRSELVGSVQRADGTSQVAYNGHPLYHYARDSGPGTTSGHDLDDQWGEWYLIAPSGEVIDDDA